MHEIRIPIESSLQFVAAGEFVCSEGGAIHPDRVMNTYVLLFGSSGVYPIAEEAEEYRLTSGTRLLLRPGVRHYGYSPSSADLTEYWCHFRLIPHENETSVTLPTFDRVASPERVRILFHQLIDASLGNSQYRIHACNALLRLLLLEMTEPIQNESASGGVALVNRVREHVRLYASEISSVGEIAAHFGYNPEYLTTLYRRITGRTVGEELRITKITEAQNLLLATDLSVKEIAFRVGFGDEKYFLRLFRAQVGATPKQYRAVFFRTYKHK